MFLRPLTPYQVSSCTIIILFIFDLSTIVIMVYLNFWLKQKNENYYKFVYMNAMIFLDLLVPSFENCSKIVIISIHYLSKKLKRGLLEGLLKIKSIAKKWKKHDSFVFMNKGTLSVTFVKLFPWPFIWNIKIHLFVNQIEVSNFTWLG